MSLNQLPESLDLDTFGPIRLVVLQSTSFCNIDCDYCYLPDRRSHNVMSLELIEPVFRRIFTSRFLGQRFTVCWHAGEPLTLPVSYYEAAIEATETLRRRLAPDCQVCYSMQTNGILIDQAWCEFFKRYSFRLGISLDGPAFIHDTHRKNRKGRGTHAFILRGIERLRENQIEFSVITVLTETALDQADAMFDFFRSYGIKQVGFNVEEIEGVNRASSLQAGDVEQRLRRFFRRFWQRTAETGGEFRLREFEQVSEFLLRDQPQVRNQLCNPFCIISLDHQGNFSTFSPELLAMQSPHYGNFVLGNVRHDSFEAICQGEKFQRLWQAITVGVTACRATCQYFTLCGGGAPSNKYWEHGTFGCAQTLACRFGKQLVADAVIDGLENRLNLV